MKNWSPLFNARSMKSKKKAGKVWSLSACFVSTSTKQQKKAIPLKYNRNTPSRRKQQVKEQLSKSCTTGEKAGAHSLESAKKWAKIFSELGRTEGSLVYIFWKENEKGLRIYAPLKNNPYHHKISFFWTRRAMNMTLAPFLKNRSQEFYFSKIPIPSLIEEPVLLESGKADLDCSVNDHGLCQERHPAAPLAACYGVPSVAASKEAVTNPLVPGVPLAVSMESAVWSLLLQCHCSATAGDTGMRGK